MIDDMIDEEVRTREQEQRLEVVMLAHPEAKVRVRAGLKLIEMAKLRSKPEHGPTWVIGVLEIGGAPKQVAARATSEFIASAVKRGEYDYLYEIGGDFPL